VAAYLTDTIKDHQLDLIFLQEIMKENYSVSFPEKMILLMNFFVSGCLRFVNLGEFWCV
jgi:hypothetical protein